MRTSRLSLLTRVDFLPSISCCHVIMTLRRTLLITPATDEALLQKGSATDADVLFLDLEDAVPSERKSEARRSVVSFLESNTELDMSLAVRINAITTSWWYEDLIDTVSASEGAVDSLIIPKVSSKKHLYAVDLLLRQVEINAGLPEGDIGLIPQLETVTAINNATDIARSVDRLTALLFGPGDYSVSVGVREPNDESIADRRWEYARSRIVNAAREVKIQALDGMYPETDDTEGFRSACQRARSLGFDGKTVVHPKQIRIANEVFTPSSWEIQRAKTIYDAYLDSGGDRETVRVDGRIIDKETFEMAEEIVEKASEAGKLDDV